MTERRDNSPEDRIGELLAQALEIDSPDRAAFLQRECGSDQALRAEVGSLLAAHDQADAWLAVLSAEREAPTRRVGERRREPKRIGRYRVVGEIGRGGMGVVYLAVREGDEFRRRVAVKVLKRGLDTDEILARFVRERRVVAALDHPGIARLLDAGETDEGQPYFAMEYVEGQRINEYFDDHRLPIAERLELFGQVCDAVQYVHQNLMVHRDLKPSNILVKGDGQAKLLDFGIAKLTNPALSPFGDDPTAPGLRVMTPEYASPEQVRGAPITVASDIYSLGVVLYELLTGHRPYRLRNGLRTDIERIICETDPELPSTAVRRVEIIEPDDGSGVSTSITPDVVAKLRGVRPQRLRRHLAGDIDNVVLKAMRKEPQRRYRSAAEFGQDIRRHLDGLPVIARRDTSLYRLRKFVRRHRVGVAAVALALTTAVTAVIAFLAASDRARLEAELSSRSAQRSRDAAASMMQGWLGRFIDETETMPGAAAVQEKLITTAQEYLLDLEEDPDAEPSPHVAHSYAYLGDVLGGLRGPNLGLEKRAAEAYQASHERWITLAEAHPNDPEVQIELGLSYRRLGDLRRASAPAEALADYHRALEHLEGQPGTERRVAIVQVAIGDMLVEAGRFTEAKAYHEKAFATFRRLDARSDDPERRRDLAVMLGRVGESLMTEDPAAAIALCRENVEIRETLAASAPDNMRYRRDLAGAVFTLGRVMFRTEPPQLEPALVHIARSLDLAEALGGRDPGNARHLLLVALGREQRGLILQAKGDLDGALADLEAFLGLAEERLAAVPDSRARRRRVAFALEHLGDVHAARRETDAARRRYDEARRTYDALELHEHSARVEQALERLE